MARSQPPDAAAPRPAKPTSLRGLAIFLFAPAVLWLALYLLGGRQTWMLVALIIFTAAAIVLLGIAAKPTKRGPEPSG